MQGGILFLSKPNSKKAVIAHTCLCLLIPSVLVALLNLIKRFKENSTPSSVITSLDEIIFLVPSSCFLSVALRMQQSLTL